MHALGAEGGWLHKWMAKNIGAAGAAAALAKERLPRCFLNAEPGTGAQEEFAAIDELRRRSGWECELVAATALGVDAVALQARYEESVADTGDA